MENHMRSIGDYRLIGPNAGVDFEPSTIFIDTNVAIDIEKFYFGPGGRNWSNLRDLLRAFPVRESRRETQVDINYGWAVSEATWPRGEGVDLIRRRRMIHANSEVINWSPDELEAAFASHRSPSAKNPNWHRSTPLENAPDVADPLIMVLSPYGALLYLLSLERDRSKWRHGDPLKQLEKYVVWSKNVLGVQSSYGLMIAIDLLIGASDRREAARKMFKWGGGESPDELAKKAWNAAWDVVFTSLTEGSSYGLMGESYAARPTILATRNDDPGYLRRNNELRTLISSGPSFQLPYALSTYETIEGIDTAAISAITATDPLDGLRRSRRDPSAVAAQAAAAVSELEDRLGVSKRTVPTGWPSSSGAAVS
jgi:hypothetical protein